MIAYPLYPARKSRSLDGLWDFAFFEHAALPLSGFDPAGIPYAERMAVPGCFDATPQYAGKRGIGVYRTTFSVTPHAHCRIVFHALGLAARVLMNGQEILSDPYPWSFTTADFTASDSGETEIVILADNRLEPLATPLFLPNYDFYGYGGIYRSVELMELPETGWFGRAAVETLSLEGRVRISGEFHGPKAVLCGGFDGAPAAELEPEWVGDNFTLEMQVPDPAVWSPESPKLHTITLKMGEDVIVERFGLRTVTCKAGQLLLNGKPVRLAGFNRHDTHPEFGPAMPDALEVADLQLLKKLNANFIRGCHYPQSQRFLDLCDELGFLVWEESLGWGNRETSTGDPEFIRMQTEQTVNMVRTSRNHPSVILWGFMNESNDHEPSGAALLHTLAETVKKEDRSRPVTCASCRIMESLALKDYDVISFNVYPAWYEERNDADPRPLHRIRERLDQVLQYLETAGFGDKPYILSEIGAGGIYGWHDWQQGFWSEEYQHDYLAAVADYFLEHPRLTGLAFWHFADARTYAATSGVLGRPRSFNNKGILDEYRRPKLAFRTVAEKFKQK